VLEEMAELNWSDEKVDNPCWIEALAEARLIAAAGGTLLPALPRHYGCLDQYAAEKARGNREYFLS
jgi:hypothetical protein